MMNNLARIFYQVIRVLHLLVLAANVAKCQVDEVGIVEYIRSKPNVIIPGIQEFEKVKLSKMDHTFIAEKWMIDRMTLFQRAVTNLRNFYRKELTELATWGINYVEAVIPEHYSCVSSTWINFVEEKVLEYPPHLLRLIADVKETFIRSEIQQIPLVDLKPKSFKHLTTVFNNFPDFIEKHRSDLITLVSQKNHQAILLGLNCTDGNIGRHSAEIDDKTAPNYLSAEDYQIDDYIPFVGDDD